MLKHTSHAEKDSHEELAKRFMIRPTSEAFHTERIHHGINVSLPIDWINFGNTLGYDAYTVKAKLKDNSVYIEKIYDQVGKGRKAAKQFSTITLMNMLCATRRK